MGDSYIITDIEVYRNAYQIDLKNTSNEVSIRTFITKDALFEALAYAESTSRYNDYMGEEYLGVNS
jgi:hypothetical protein